MYAHPVAPLHDHAPTLTAYQFGRDATRAAFRLVSAGDFAAAAAEFHRAAAATEVVAAALWERSHQHDVGSVEHQTVTARAHRWTLVAAARGEYAAQCKTLDTLSGGATRAALETWVIAHQHRITTAQAELALDVTASAIAGDPNLTVAALADHLGCALRQPHRRGLALLADHTARLCGSTLPHEQKMEIPQ